MRHPIACGIAVVGLAALAHGQQQLVQHAGPVFSPYGVAVAVLGDVNGDGIGDYAYSDYYADGTFSHSGKIFVRSGAGFGPLYEISGPNVDAYLGKHVEAVGDVDDDGVPDFVATSENGSIVGRVTTYSGVDGSVIASVDMAPAELTVSDLAATGDVDLDGVPDFALGLPYGDAGGTNSGAVRVLGGGDGALIWERIGDSAGESWGQTVGGPGDVDADGFMDFGAGTRLFSVGGTNRGMVRVYAGRTGAVLHEVIGENAGDFLATLAPLGDADGDGFDDFMVGSDGWGPFGGSNKYGLVQAFRGVDGSLLWTVEGASGTSAMGREMTSLGDLDGDGRGEALLGAPDVDDFSDGRVEVHSGATGALLFAFEGGYVGDDFGAALASGDVNGDGVDDILVGSPGMSSVRLFTPTCGAFVPYGSGCAGSGGITPTLGLAGCATPGGTLNFTVDRALGGSTAVLILSLLPADLPFKGCTLLVQPTLLLPLPLGGSGAGKGKVQFPATLTVPTPLISVYVQAFVADPGASHGWASSAAVEIAID
ncbi:MAG: VCBS repeat-containing protein [Myxococcales bacterium]|nr:VCBS repeat-containing protein [Myxococcales bacterium]